MPFDSNDEGLKRVSMTWQAKFAGSLVMGALVRQRGGGRAPGGAVQVDPMNPTLKAPVSKSLKLKHDKLLSNFGFKFNLRHYNLAVLQWQGLTLVHLSAQHKSFP
jgi:hypothetical protein